MCMWPSIRPRTALHGALPTDGAPLTSSAISGYSGQPPRATNAQRPRSPAAPRSRRMIVPSPATVSTCPPAAGRSTAKRVAGAVHAPVGGLARRRGALHAVAGLRGGGARQPGHRQRVGRRRHRDRGRLADAHEVALRAVEQVPPERRRLHPERLGAVGPARRGPVAAVGCLGDELAGRHRLQRVAPAGQRVAVRRLRLARKDAHRDQDDEREAEHGGDDTPKAGATPPAARSRASAPA